MYMYMYIHIPSQQVFGDVSTNHEWNGVSEPEAQSHKPTNSTEIRLSLSLYIHVCVHVGEREGGREGEREGGREGEREGGREGEREGGREGTKECGGLD